MSAVLRIAPRRGPPCRHPRATIIKPASGSGRCSGLASSHGARIDASHSSSVVSITGIALSWIGSTIKFGAVARKPYAGRFR
jgi:hypothetical protein